MINDLSLWMGPVKIPVFVLNTGDEAFIMDQNSGFKDSNRDRETLYQQRPRIELDIQNIDFQRDEITNPHQTAKFKLNMSEGTREFRTKVQRIPMTMNIGLHLITDNILSALKYMEILTMILAKHNVYEFTYLSKTYSGAYIFNFNMGEEKNLTMSYDHERRNRIITTELSLQLQYPSYNLFRKYPGVGMPPEGSFGNGLDGDPDNDGNGNGGIIPDPDLEDITDGENKVKWSHHIKDKNNSFETRTDYDGTVENPIPEHITIKPLPRKD
ncbi:gp176 [Sphingomonas phage PAU]|uniref:gp176 n=1 Tax=Sphingomonas phage PAU TaxID=1150991 RepID=UPI00025732FC|nr:gp176 [Sphingomonas phage PAU]AFF28174.1 gp176 [Sphingomonas phage PAU]